MLTEAFLRTEGLRHLLGEGLALVVVVEAEAGHLALQEACEVIHTGVITLDVHHDLILGVSAAGLAALDVNDVDAVILGEGERAGEQPGEAKVRQRLTSE